MQRTAKIQGQKSDVISTGRTIARSQREAIGNGAGKFTSPCPKLPANAICQECGGTFRGNGCRIRQHSALYQRSAVGCRSKRPETKRPASIQGRLAYAHKLRYIKFKSHAGDRYGRVLCREGLEIRMGRQVGSAIQRHCDQDTSGHGCEIQAYSISDNAGRGGTLCGPTRDRQNGDGRRVVPTPLNMRRQRTAVAIPVTH